MLLARQKIISELIYVHNPRDGHQGKRAKMRVEQYRLRISVTDHPHPAVPSEILQLRFELIPEILIFQVVDPPPESDLPVVKYQSRPLGTEVGMIVRTVKHIINTTPFGDRTVKSAHEKI